MGIIFFFFLGIRKYKEVLFVLTLENYKRLLGEKNYRIKNIFLKIFFLCKSLLKEFSRAFFLFLFLGGNGGEREREVGCHY